MNTNYRDVPREALVAEIERLQREVALLRRPAWWERLFARRGAALKLPASPEAPLAPQPDGAVLFTKSRKFVCVTLRGVQYARPYIRDLETYPSLGEDEWFVASTGNPVSAREAGAECFRLFCAHFKAGEAARNAANLRAEMKAEGLLR